MRCYLKKKKKREKNAGELIVNVLYNVLKIIDRNFIDRRRFHYDRGNNIFFRFSVAYASRGRAAPTIFSSISAGQ